MPRYGIFAENAFRLTEGQSVVPSDGYRALCQLCVSGNKVSQTSQALEGINVGMSPGGAPFSNERISHVRSQIPMGQVDEPTSDGGRVGRRG